MAADAGFVALDVESTPPALGVVDDPSILRRQGMNITFMVRSRGLKVVFENHLNR